MSSPPDKSVDKVSFTMSLESTSFVSSSTSFWYQFLQFQLTYSFTHHFFLFWFTTLLIHLFILLFNGSYHIKQHEQPYQGHEMPLTGNNNLIYLISSTVSSNTACSQKCVKISAVFKNRLNDCNVLKSGELASSAFRTLTTRLQKKYFHNSLSLILPA